MNIKHLREKTNMTQKEFADYFDIPKRTIENWEGGQRNPPPYVVELIKYKIKKERLIMLKNIEVRNIEAKGLVELFDLFDGEEITEKEFVEKAEEEQLDYILYIDENSTGTIAERKGNSANDVFFDVYTDDFSMEDLEELNGVIERLD